MHDHRTRLFALPLLLLAVACRPGAEGPDARELAAELLQADLDFAALSENTNPRQAFSRFLAPNAMLIGRSGDPVEGYDAAIASFGDEDRFQLHWQPQFAEAAKAGDMGWTWGRYQLLAEGEQLYSGKYVNIWIRQPDGSWKVRVDMGNQAPETP